MEIYHIKNSVIMTLPDTKNYIYRNSVIRRGINIVIFSDVRFVKKIHIFTDFESDKVADSVNYVSNLFAGGRTYAKFIIHGKYTNEQIFYIKQKTKGVDLDFYHIDKLAYKINNKYIFYTYDKEFNGLGSWCEHIKEYH